MRREKISEVIDNISTKYVDEATQYSGKVKSSHKVMWYRLGAVSVCISLLVLFGIKLIPTITKEENVSQGKYKYQVSGTEADIEWTWEYKTVGEKYNMLIYNGSEYSIKNMNPIPEDLLGERLGTGQAKGLDLYTDKEYTESFTVYEISGVSEEKLIAAGMDSEFYVYRMMEENKKHYTFGELMTVYGLNENLDLNHFSICEGYEEEGHYILDDDEYIWKILLECNEAVLDDSVDLFDRSNRNYLSFTATSDKLGVYKRVVYISEDGYFATNIFDYSYIYFIGIDAAEKIMKYAKNNALERKFEAYELTVSGKLVEIGEGYVLVDDSVLCNNSEDGTVYKIYTDDIRIKRCIDTFGINVGDIVAIKYRDEINALNEVIGAYSMCKGELVEGDIVVQE